MRRLAKAANTAAATSNKTKYLSMAAALEAVKPLSMTFLSACGNASMAAAATSSAPSAINILPRYGARNGSNARSGLSDLDLGLSMVVTKPESAQVQFPPHAEVAGQAVERVAEGGGLVVLEHEMTKPGEAVPAEHGADQPPHRAGRDQRQRAQHRAPGADVVQSTRHRVPV